MMELEEFCERTNAALEHGDITSVQELESIAREFDNPHFYSCLAWMYKPFDEEAIERALKDIERAWLKSATYELPGWLANIEGYAKIKNLAASERYFKLAFSGFQKLASDTSDPDAMSILSNMYAQGLGTDIDISQSRYWLNRCYLQKTGMTFDEWKKANS